MFVKVIWQMKSSPAKKEDWSGRIETLSDELCRPDDCDMLVLAQYSTEAVGGRVTWLGCGKKVVFQGP